MGQNAPRTTILRTEETSVHRRQTSYTVLQAPRWAESAVGHSRRCLDGEGVGRWTQRRDGVLCPAVDGGCGGAGCSSWRWWRWWWGARWCGGRRVGSGVAGATTTVRRHTTVLVRVSVSVVPNPHRPTRHDVTKQFSRVASGGENWVFGWCQHPL